MSSSDKKFSSGPSPGPTGKYASDMAGRAGRLGAPAQPGEPSRRPTARRRACALPRPAPAGAAPLRPAPGGGKGAGPGLGGALPRGRAGTAAGVRPPHPCWPRRLAALGPGQARCRAKGRPGLGRGCELPGAGPGPALACPCRRGLHSARRRLSAASSLSSTGRPWQRLRLCFQPGLRAAPCSRHPSPARPASLVLQADGCERGVSKACPVHVHAPG